MPVWGPWIDTPVVWQPTSFLARTLRARTMTWAALEGLTDSFASMRPWWLTGSTPPWPEPIGTFDVAFPRMSAVHEYPQWDMTFRRLDQWLPLSVDATQDRFNHHGHLYIADDHAQAEHATPLLGSWAWPEVSVVPDVPPPGAIGVDVEDQETVLARRAWVSLVADVPFGAQSVSVVRPPSAQWSRTGPARNDIPGNAGLADYGDPSVWVDPDFAPVAWAWAPDAESTATITGSDTVLLPVDLPIAEDFAALAPMSSLWRPTGTPAGAQIHVQITSITVETQVRPRRYRWLYEGSQGTWRLRQRQSLPGADSWPTRQRQHGGHTGSWPVRQRQTGV